MIWCSTDVVGEFVDSKVSRSCSRADNVTHNLFSTTNYVSEDGGRCQVPEVRRGVLAGNEIQAGFTSFVLALGLVAFRLTCPSDRPFQIKMEVQQYSSHIYVLSVTAEGRHFDPLKILETRLPNLWWICKCNHELIHSLHNET
jgi:hypothetical protein